MRGGEVTFCSSSKSTLCSSILVHSDVVSVSLWCFVRYVSILFSIFEQMFSFIVLSLLSYCNQMTAAGLGLINLRWNTQGKG